MQILTISNVPHDPNQGSGYVISGYVEGLRERGYTVEAHGPDDWQYVNIHRGRRYLHPLLIAFFGLVQCQPQEYDIVELWGGTTWLLAVCLRWMHLEGVLVHRSNGIEQHRTDVQEASQGMGDRHWIHLDMSLLYDWGLRATDAVITVSSYDEPFLRKNSYVSDDRVYSIENPLPESFLDQSLDQSRPNRIGFCGRWIPRKGVSLLETDVPSMLRRHPEWTFSIVGVRGKNVKSQFPADVQDQIEVIPFLERSDLIEWYKSLSVFTLPSIYESFGLVMAEAMACGAALVATNVGFAHGLEHKREAYILPSSQSPHLKEALTNLSESETLRRQIARNGYERVQDLRWDDAVDRLEEIYERLVHEHSATG